MSELHEQNRYNSVDDYVQFQPEPNSCTIHMTGLATIIQGG